MLAFWIHSDNELSDVYNFIWLAGVSTPVPGVQFPEPKLRQAESGGIFHLARPDSYPLPGRILSPS